MKTYFSLSLKLTIIVVAVSAAVIFSLTLYNISEQSIDFENIYVDKAKDSAAVLDLLWSDAPSNNTIGNEIFYIIVKERINSPYWIDANSFYQKSSKSKQKRKEIYDKIEQFYRETKNGLFETWNYG